MTRKWRGRWTRGSFFSSGFFYFKKIIQSIPPYIYFSKVRRIFLLNASLTLEWFEFFSQVWRNSPAAMSAKAISEASGKALLVRHLSIPGNVLVKPQYAVVNEETKLDRLVEEHPWLQTEASEVVKMREEEKFPFHVAIYSASCLCVPSPLARLRLFRSISSQIACANSRELQELTSREAGKTGLSTLVNDLRPSLFDVGGGGGKLPSFRWHYTVKRSI